MQQKHAPIVLSQRMLWIMAVLSGLVVANNYYNQPLLGLIADELNFSETQVSRIAVLTQIGYALGLLFIVPLGDKLFRKKLILVDLALVFLSLLLMAYGQSLWVLYLASLFIGVTSVVPQLFVPMAAELSNPEDRSGNIGLVMSGLLIGILLSRFFGGIIGDLWGWRSMFKIAAGLMLFSWALVYRYIPELSPNFSGSYGTLMKSVWQLAKTQPVLQLASFRGAMVFGALSVVFTTLVFHMQEAPFHAGASIAGGFGLIGAVGATAAAFIGRLTKRYTRYTLSNFALVLLLISWLFLYFTGFTYWGLIIGIILVDLGVQSAHILNQSDYFALPITATNRLNTVYMVCYFIGGSSGTFLGALGWQYAGWTGVCVVGVLFSLLALVAHLLFARRVNA